MAWYQTNKTAAAGELKNFLDYLITNYGTSGGYGWSIYDTEAGTNIGVYKCKPDDTNSFILVVKDNQSNYADIEYWDDWNTSTHSGVGNSMTYGRSSPYLLRIRKAAGVFSAAINIRRILMVMMAGGWATFMGYPARWDETKNTPIYIGHDGNTGSASYSDNPLAGNVSPVSTGPAINYRAMYNSIGMLNQELITFSSASTSSYYPKRYIKTTAGKYMIIEEPVAEWGSPYMNLGILEGVMGLGNSLNGLVNGDFIVVGTVVWLVVQGANNTICLVKEV